VHRLLVSEFTLTTFALWGPPTRCCVSLKLHYFCWHQVLILRKGCKGKTGKMERCMTVMRDSGMLVAWIWDPIDACFHRTNIKKTSKQPGVSFPSSSETSAFEPIKPKTAPRKRIVPTKVDNYTVEDWPGHDASMPELDSKFARLWVVDGDRA